MDQMSLSEIIRVDVISWTLQKPNFFQNFKQRILYSQVLYILLAITVVYLHE